MLHRFPCICSHKHPGLHRNHHSTPTLYQHRVIEISPYGRNASHTTQSVAYSRGGDKGANVTFIPTIEFGVRTGTCSGFVAAVWTVTVVIINSGPWNYFGAIETRPSLLGAGLGGNIASCQTWRYSMCFVHGRQCREREEEES